MRITITPSSSPEAWGADCDETLAQEAASCHADALCEYAAGMWPEAEILSGTRKASAPLAVVSDLGHDLGPNEAGSIIQAIRQVSEFIWTESLQVALDRLRNEPEPVPLQHRHIRALSMDDGAEWVDPMALGDVR